MNRWSSETPINFCCLFSDSSNVSISMGRTQGRPSLLFSFFFYFSVSHQFSRRCSTPDSHSGYLSLSFPRPLLGADRDVREVGHFWKATFCELQYVVA